jgi:hypothetical protein
VTSLRSSQISFRPASNFIWIWHHTPCIAPSEHIRIVQGQKIVMAIIFRVPDKRIYDVTLQNQRMTTHARRNTDATVLVGIRKSKWAPEWDRGALTARCRLATTYKHYSVHTVKKRLFANTANTILGPTGFFEYHVNAAEAAHEEQEEKPPWSNCIILFEKKMATMAWEFKSLDQTWLKKVLVCGCNRIPRFFPMMAIKCRKIQFEEMELA